MQPRDDLRGKSPRDVLLEKQKYISRDVEDRAQQWSLMGACPRGLDPQSHAFRFAGFGRHEVVKYYDLVRDLLACCWNRLLELSSDPRPQSRPQALSRGDFLTDEVPRLQQWRDAWLETPDPECHGLTPREVNDHERARIPEGLSGKHAMVDHDCPLCQMMSDMPGPMFWGLDGSHLDDDFVFSFYRTREEWDEEERRREEFHRRYKEQEAECERLGVKYPGKGYADPDYVWERSFVVDEENPELPLAVRLFSIGSLLAELIVDLKSPSEEHELIDALNHDWGNLREVCQNEDPDEASALVEPVLDRFCETLNSVALAREDLAEKCDDFQERLQRFLEPPSEVEDESDDDYPVDDIPF